MTPCVHYLVRNPRRLGELLYPIEVDDDYQSFGTFFFLGEHPDDIRNAYTFHAVHNGDLISTVLTRVGSSAIYRVVIENMGIFEFHATKIGTGGHYSGSFTPTDGVYAIRQLAVINHQLLDLLAERNNFFFVGYTPRSKQN